MATVRIPLPLRRFTDGAEEVAATGTTVAEIIADIDGVHTEFKKRIFDENGKIRRFVNIYVNDEDIRFMQNLDTPVGDDDEISIVPAVAGGLCEHDT